MKLDRNANTDRLGKYALLKLRRLSEYSQDEFPGDMVEPVKGAIDLLDREGLLDWGNKLDTEFFVVRLKDMYAKSALLAYADAAERDGEHEFAEEVAELAARAGPDHPHCKRPD